MEKFVINGGAPLSGEITVAGNKNAPLPILAACLLTEEEVLLHRVPRIRDTEAQIALLEQLGVEVDWVGDNSVRLCAAGVTAPVLDEELSSQIRASFLLAGPLLARFGEEKMPPPGGDFIGPRRAPPNPAGFPDPHATARRRLNRPAAARPAPRRLPRSRRPHRWLALDRAERADRTLRLRHLHG